MFKQLGTNITVICQRYDLKSNMSQFPQLHNYVDLEIRFNTALPTQLPVIMTFTSHSEFCGYSSYRHYQTQTSPPGCIKQ